MDARHAPMRAQQQQPAQRGGRGNASRLQPMDRDASFGSGSGIPEAGLGGGTSGEATAGGSSSGRRTPDGQAPNRPVNLRTGSFRFQVCITCTSDLVASLSWSGKAACRLGVKTFLAVKRHLGKQQDLSGDDGSVQMVCAAGDTAWSRCMR